jgi:hypothetical protein
MGLTYEDWWLPSCFPGQHQQQTKLSEQTASETRWGKPAQRLPQDSLKVPQCLPTPVRAPLCPDPPSWPRAGGIYEGTVAPASTPTDAEL